MYRFEKLRVYQNALQLVEEVYKVVRRLPSDERFGLADQLRRAVISIVLNIAEGSGGLGDKEFKKYLRSSLGSLYETVAALKIAESLFKVDVQKSISQCDTVGKELRALINSLSKN